MRVHGIVLSDTVTPLYLCEGKLFGYSSDVLIYPFPTLPTIGEHDYSVCNGCLTTYDRIFETVTNHFGVFPFCCEDHKNLLGINGFEKNKMSDVPRLISEKVVFTCQHIINSFQSGEGLEDIVQYFDYTVFSFGAMPPNCGEPFMLSTYVREVKSFLSRNYEYFGKRKVESLINYIDNYFSQNENKGSDINILLQTYSKWLKLFPFELDYFVGIKKDFENTLPFLASKPVFNRYLKMDRVVLHTRDTLLELLMSISRKLLQEMNGLELYNNGVLDNIDSRKLQLILVLRDRELKEGYFSEAKNEDVRFRRIVKKWLKDEIRFIKDIEPFVRSSKAKVNRGFKIESLEDLFVDRTFFSPCLEVLQKLEPPVLDSHFNYIGKNKGVIPLWIKVLRHFKGKSLIKPIGDKDLVRILNKYIPGLNLSKDASEFRKRYSRISKSDLELDMKAILSQFSQMGRLG